MSRDGSLNLKVELREMDTVTIQNKKEEKVNMVVEETPIKGKMAPKRIIKLNVGGMRSPSHFWINSSILC
jgi:hypothetical protein